MDEPIPWTMLIPFLLHNVLYIIGNLVKGETVLYYNVSRVAHNNAMSRVESTTLDGAVSPLTDYI